MVKPWYQSIEFLVTIAVLILNALLMTYLLRRHRPGSRIETKRNKRLTSRANIGRAVSRAFPKTLRTGRIPDPIAQSTYNVMSDMRHAHEKLSEYLGMRNDAAGALDRAAGDAGLKPMEVTFSIAGELEGIDITVRAGIQGIAFEAIENVFIHSRGTHLDVTLVHHRDFSLHVIDDGCGFNFAAPKEGELALSGLARMFEGAARIGGSLRISSSRSAGTEVHLLVPRSSLRRKRNRTFPKT